MSLAIYGEDGEPITESHPLITEHDGENGEAVDKVVTIKNETEDYTFKRVSVEGTPENPGRGCSYRGIRLIWIEEQPERVYRIFRLSPSSASS